MTSAQNEREMFRSYLREFRALRKEGAKLFYPGEQECSPRYLAEEMAYDSGATYMRDAQCTKEGKVVSVHFCRIPCGV